MRARTLGLLGAILLGSLWILNLPFYSGAGGPHLSWRMEHGRVKVAYRSEPVSPETFYVAFNSEGLRFAPEWDFRGKDWMINVPLWIPLAACVALAIRRRRDPRPTT